MLHLTVAVELLMSVREETDVSLEPALCEGIFRPAVKIPQRNAFLSVSGCGFFYFKALTGLLSYISKFAYAQGQHILFGI